MYARLPSQSPWPQPTESAATQYHTQQYPSAPYFFFGPNIGFPMFSLSPVNLTFAAFCNFSTTSIDGNSAPVRSRSATYFTSTAALEARSFCVIVAPFWFLSWLRAWARALETSSGTFFVATGPSARSTLVRRWPSGLLPVWIEH